MAKTIQVSRAWIWLAAWFGFDIASFAMGWCDAEHFRHKILEDSAIAFFILGLWLVSSFDERAG